MTVYFANDGELDLSLITIMGISVKVRASPIGFFGTGLKFALATLLRTGHRVELRTGGRRHTFSLAEREIRGEKFRLVCMDGEALPFADTLGKNWEPWQAYRELASNARDEPGTLVTSDHVDPADHGTCWIVNGEGIEAAHRERDEIFCASRVLHRREGYAEVREGRSHHVFYRGVRVWTLPTPSLWTWNFLSPVTLTEDRTLKWMHELHYPMAQLIAHSDDAEFVGSALTAHEEVLESRADFDYVHEPGETYMAVARSTAASGMLTVSARRLWERTAPAVDVYEDALLDTEDDRMIHEATQLCLAIDPDYLLDPRYVVSLGDGCYGMVRGEDVMVSHAAVTMGVDFLAATLYEEYLHRQHGFKDETRSMQNHLFQQLVRLSRRVG